MFSGELWKHEQIIVVEALKQSKKLYENALEKEKEKPSFINVKGFKNRIIDIDKLIYKIGI